MQDSFSSTHALDPQVQTLNPKPQTRTPKPQTLNPKPQPPNPKLQTLKQVVLPPAVDLAGFDARQHPDWQRGGTTHPPANSPLQGVRDGLAGPLQQAFNVSFTSEQVASSQP